MKRHELVGTRSGKLTVLGYVRTDSTQGSMWECLCECGGKAVVRGTSLVQQRTLSCGCIVRKHGKINSPEYHSWQAVRGQKTTAVCKTTALLMAALQFVRVPDYHAIIFKRTYSQLHVPGGIVETAKKFLEGKATWNIRQMRWTFPNGAKLSFDCCANMEGAQHHAGADYQFIGFDDYTTDLAECLGYLKTRLRKPQGSHIPLRLRTTMQATEQVLAKESLKAAAEQISAATNSLLPVQHIDDFIASTSWDDILDGDSPAPKTETVMDICRKVFIGMVQEKAVEYGISSGSWTTSPKSLLENIQEAFGDPKDFVTQPHVVSMALSKTEAEALMQRSETARDAILRDPPEADDDLPKPELVEKPK